MRTWKKPKSEYSKKEIKTHIKKWIKSEEGYNCGHSVYCMRLLIDFKLATLDEIVNSILENNNIQFAHEIGTW